MRIPRGRQERQKRYRRLRYEGIAARDSRALILKLASACGRIPDMENVVCMDDA